MSASSPTTSDFVIAALGVAFVLCGSLLFVKPRWVDWLNDEINGWAVRWWRTVSGSDERLRKHEHDKPAFRKLFPAALVLLGVLWIVAAVT